MMAATALSTVMTLGELLGAVPAELSGMEITDVVMDSRQASPGSAFVAVQGASSHGLEYAPDAVARGASVVIFEPAPGVGDSVPEVPSVAVPNLRGRLGELGRKFYSPAQSATHLAGITGTNGKSTVAYLVAQAQTLRGVPCGYVGDRGCRHPSESGIPVADDAGLPFPAPYAAIVVRRLCRAGGLLPRPGTGSNRRIEH